MDLSFSPDFLFGLVCGVLVMILSRPLMRMFQQGMRLLPLIVMIALLCFIAYFLLFRG